jgi:hypothetical protein
VSVSNDIYQTVRVEGGRVVCLAAHLRVASEAFRALYGVWPALEADAISALIISQTGNNSIARLWIDPVQKMTVKAGGQLLYPGYVAWHKRFKAIAAPYEMMGDVPCRATLVGAAYAEHCARANGYDAALHLSDGVVAGLAAGVWCGEDVPPVVDEWPVFCVYRTGVVSASHVESVHRQWGEAALAWMGYRCTHREVCYEEAMSADEIFAITPQGAISLQSLDERLLFSTLADKVGEQIQRTGPEKLAGEK